MKAIVQHRYGSADELALADIDRPAPTDDEVLVRVHAAGVDPSVWHIMEGKPYLIRAVGFGMRAPKTLVRGSDVAGVIEATGANVTGFAPGDEVFGMSAGSFAEFAIARQDRLARKPARLSFVEAAAMPTSGVTALQALRDRGGVKPGQRVLVIGAGGGVGSFAVQLAVDFGAHVTGVCSTAKVPLVSSLGADEVIDYTRDGLETQGPRFDLVVDTAGNRRLSILRHLLAPGGTLVLVGGEGGGPVLGGISRNLRAGVVAPFARQSLGGMLARANAGDLEYLAERAQAGAVTPHIEQTFPLDRAADAVRRLADGHVAGKLVVTVP
ncbi:NAD(P)-dependent alcohol dehydrogenase [Diaminobutyricibacter sp. McL0618]|uniref:NAD(P)-dependent alcohol dehydrogenase n=1 Tax=Leifsonia sp. McL0618 TaxID=3415677 RepID=UPI003CE89152